LETGALKNKRPSSNIHTGVLDATSVTFMGEDVLSARYCSELYRPTPSSPSSANRRQCGHKGLPGRSTQPAMGSSMSSASAQRRKFRVNGGTTPCIMRPTTALPAHIRGGSISSTSVVGVRRADGLVGMAPL